MPVGVTSFIAGSLARGKRFSIGGGLDAKRGLAIGRATDMLVRRVVKDGAHLDGRRQDHARARAFFALLAAAKITVRAAQVPCVDHRLNIRTEIDAVGTDRACRKVAIELKTTQHTKAAFCKAYYTPCRNQPSLTNLLPNCLYWRHQLQCGFAVVASDCTRGVVAVMCADGGVLFDVTPTACDRAMFVGCAPPAAGVHAPLLSYPTRNDTELRAALRTKLRYTTVVRQNPTVVRGPHGDAVLLLVHKGPKYSATKAAAGHRARARALAAEHRVAAVVGWLDRGRWRVKTQVKREHACPV